VWLRLRVGLLAPVAAAVPAFALQQLVAHRLLGRIVGEVARRAPHEVHFALFLRSLAELLAHGTLGVPIASVRPLEQAAQALREVVAGADGAIVLSLRT